MKRKKNFKNNEFFTAALLTLNAMEFCLYINFEKRKLMFRKLATAVSLIGLLTSNTLYAKEISEADKVIKATKETKETKKEAKRLKKKLNSANRSLIIRNLNMSLLMTQKLKRCLIYTTPWMWMTKALGIGLVIALWKTKPISTLWIYWITTTIYP